RGAAGGLDAGGPVIRSGPRLWARLALLGLTLVAVSAASRTARSQPAPVDSATALPAAFVPPAPPSGLVLDDVPNDAGRALDAHWNLSPDDSAGRHVVRGYVLERSESPGGPWSAVDSVAAGVHAVSDAGVKRNTTYFYRVSA